MSVIKVENLTKTFANHMALNNISFEINDSEIVVWEEIILKALKLSKNPNNIVLDEWNEYINQHKKNLSIFLNQIISKNQTNSVDKNIVKIKRFKPL